MNLYPERVSAQSSFLCRFPKECYFLLVLKTGDDDRILARKGDSTSNFIHIFGLCSEGKSFFLTSSQLLTRDFHFIRENRLISIRTYLKCIVWKSNVSSLYTENILIAYVSARVLNLYIDRVTAKVTRHEDVNFFQFAWRMVINTRLHAHIYFRDLS